MIDVDLLDAAVDEADAVALQLGDVGLGYRVARAQAQQELAGDGGMGVEEPVVRLGRPKSSMRPEVIRGRSCANPSLQAERQPRVRSCTSWSVGRPNAYFGRITQPPLGREEDLLCDALAGQLGDDVAALLPMPTTRTRLPTGRAARVGSM